MSEMSELQAIIAFVCTTEVLYLSDVSFSEVATILRVSSSQFESVALVFWTIVSVSFTNNSYLGPNLLNGGSRGLSRNSHPTCRRSMQEHSIPRLPQDRPNHPLSTAQPLSQGFKNGEMIRFTWTAVTKTFCRVDWDRAAVVFWIR